MVNTKQILFGSVHAMLLVGSPGQECNDLPLPQAAGFKDCSEVQAKGICKDSQQAEWFCPKTCDLCVVLGEDQCEWQGKKFDHGFQSCYDECHKDCHGKKWLCWHGKWYEKGLCQRDGQHGESDDECIGDDGKKYDDGYHACYDKCYPACKGNKWICHHGDWVPKGKCSMEGSAHDYGEDSAYEWSTFGKSSYMRMSKMPQSEIKRACHAVGAVPVQISDDEENNFVRRVCSIYGPCWIGLAEQRHSEEWRWMDGTLPRYFNWQNGEPNNWGHVDESAAIMSYPAGSRNGKWFDAPSSWDKPLAICERSQTMQTPPLFSLPPLAWMFLGGVLTVSGLMCVSVSRSKRKQFAQDEGSNDLPRLNFGHYNNDRSAME